MDRTEEATCRLVRKRIGDVELCSISMSFHLFFVYEGGIQMKEFSTKINHHDYILIVILITYQ